MSRFLVLASILFLTLNPRAQGTEGRNHRTLETLAYSRFPFPVKRIPKSELRELRYRHAENRWGAFDSRDQGNIPILFIDQVYFNSTFDQFVSLKLDAVPKQPGLENILIETPGGQAFHTQLADQTRVGIYFQNFTNAAARLHLEKIFGFKILGEASLQANAYSRAGGGLSAQILSQILESTIDSRFKLFQSFLGTPAFAGCALDPAGNPSGNDTSAGEAQKLNRAVGKIVMDLTMPNMNCLVNALKGLWDGSIGGLWEALKSIGGAAEKLLIYAKDHPEQIISPTTLITGFLAENLGNLALMVGSVFKKLDKIMPGIKQVVIERPDLVSGFICRVVASFAPAALLAIFTDGAGAALAAEGAEWMIQIASKLSLFAKLGEVLAEEGTLGRIFEGILQGENVVTHYLEQAERLKNLKIPWWTRKLAECAI